MAINFLKPGWFSGYDILLELAFAVVALIVAIYAYKIYRLTKKEDSKLLAIAFFLLSASYITLSISNFSTLGVIGGRTIVPISTALNLLWLNNIAIYLHMLFFISGLIFLAYMHLKVRSKKVFSLIYLLTIISLLFSTNKLIQFYILSSFFLIFTSIYYYNNYIKNRQTNTLLVFIAFLLLLFGRIHFIFSVNHELFYPIGHFLELISYGLILINIIKLKGKNG